MFGSLLSCDARSAAGYLDCMRRPSPASAWDRRRHLGVDGRNSSLTIARHPAPQTWRSATYLSNRIMPGNARGRVAKDGLAFGLERGLSPVHRSFSTCRAALSRPPGRPPAARKRHQKSFHERNSPWWIRSALCCATKFPCRSVEPSEIVDSGSLLWASQPLYRGVCARRMTVAVRRECRPIPRLCAYRADARSRACAA